MNIHETLAEWSAWGWPLFISHLWQATLVTLVIWLATWLWRRDSPRLRHGLWLLASARFIFPVALVSLLFRSAGTGEHRSAVESILAAVEPIVDPLGQGNFLKPNTTSESGHVELFCVLTIVWMLGVVLLLSLRLRRRWYFSRALRAGCWSQHSREAMALRRVMSWLLIKTKIELVVSNEINEPGVWRLCRPVIVFPQGMADRLTEEELEAVMIHELIHVQRSDNLFSTLQMGLCCLLWFHPLIWLMNRKLMNERELICDQEVLKHTGEPEAYIGSLWKIAKFGFGWPVAGVSRLGNSNLKRRVEEMLSKKENKSTRLRRVITTMGVISLVIVWMISGLNANKVANAHHQDRVSANAGAGEQEVWSGEIVDIKSVTTKPRILHRERVDYTHEARLNRTEGTVVLSCVFTADGRTRNIQVIEELPDGLTESAVEAAQQIRFVPATKNGVPVSVRITLEFEFIIEPSPAFKRFQ